MAPYQKPTVEEIEDEARRIKENGIRMQVVGLSSAAAVVNEAKRLRKRKCPWESTQRIGKMPTACR